MLMGPQSSAAEREEFGRRIKANPRNYLAQPLISLSTVPILGESAAEPRHVDLRPFILQGADRYVTAGGLTRVALAEGGFVVNSSQGGGSKDTWVVMEGDEDTPASESDGKTGVVMGKEDNTPGNGNGGKARAAMGVGDAVAGG